MECKCMGCIRTFLVICALSVYMAEGWQLGYRKWRRVITSLEFIQFLTPYHSDYAVTAGAKLSIKCRARSIGVPDIQWLRKIENGNIEHEFEGGVRIGNEVYIVENRVQSFKSRYGIYVAKLVINQTGLGDSGIYACRIRNNGSLIMKKFNIKIYAEEVIPVRLSSHTDEGEGRVEVFYSQRWGSLCHFDFETPEASTICRMLGYRYGGIPRFHFEEKAVIRYGGPGWYQQLPCPLNGSNIGQCAEWQDEKNCRGDYTVGVTCYRQPMQVPEVPIRLTGSSPEDGAVEVYRDGYWGRICTYGLGENELNTICRMLGYDYGGRLFNSSTTLLGGKPILIQGLVCPSDAPNLDDCTHSGWRGKCERCSCNLHTNVAVDCKTSANEDDPNVIVRLAASNIPHEGRLEVFYNGTWGTVAGQWLGYEGANAMCKTMGYIYGGIPLFTGTPPGFGKIWINYMECPLNASSIHDCEISWGKTRFSYHTQDIGVRCRTEPREVPEFPYRLVGPLSASGEGKLETFRDGYWGTVCGAYWGTPEANTICNMLGYRFGGNTYSNPDPYPILRWDNRPILSKYLDCPLDAGDVNNCSHRTWGDSDIVLSCTRIDHAKDVMIKCRTEDFPEYQVKFTHGPSEHEGILNSFHDNDWYPICGSTRDPRALSVVCRQLGNRHGGELKQYFEYIEKPFRMKYLDCTGKETNIGHCNAADLSSYCWNDGYFGAKCYNATDVADFIVTLVNGADEKSGRVVIERLERQWDICVEWWDDIHATATCQMLGYTTGNATYVEYEPPDSQTVRYTIKRMFCEKGVSSLGDCFHTGWTDDECYPSYWKHRAGVICS